MVDRYREHLEEVFGDVHYYHSILHLSSALYSLLHALELLPWQHSIPSESVRDVLRFATVSMEVSTGSLLSAASNSYRYQNFCFHFTLHCFDAVV